MSNDVIEVPPLGSILAYRGVYALTSINDKTGMLRATHYATCLVGGREPWWGVWTVNGVFQRFFSSKEDIRTTYPKLVWRRKNATWNMIGVNDMDAGAKRKELAELFHKGNTFAEKPVAALFSNGDVRPWRATYNGKATPLFTGVLAQSIEKVA